MQLQGEHRQMERNDKFDLGGIMGVAAAAMMASDVIGMASGAGNVAEDIIDECCVIL